MADDKTNAAEEGLREGAENVAEAAGAKESERRVDFRQAGEGLPTGEMHEPSPEEKKARDRRNVAIALAVAGFVVLVFLTSFFRLQQNLSAGGTG